MDGLAVSKLDWAALFSAVQALILVIAAVVAYEQLLSYRAMELAKNTIGLFQQMDGKYAEVINFTVRPGRRRRFPERNVTRATSWITAKRSQRYRSIVIAKFIECAQFFDLIAIQIEHGTVNRNLYMNRALALTLEVYGVLSAIDALIPGTYDLTDFTRLARVCHHRYRLLHANDEDPSLRVRYLMGLAIPR